MLVSLLKQLYKIGKGAKSIIFVEDILKLFLTLILTIFREMYLLLLT